MSKNGRHNKHANDPVARYWLKITRPARMEAARRVELPKSVNGKKGRLKYLV